MKKNCLLAVLFLFFAVALPAQCTDFFDVVVAQDGSGDFVTIQSAIEAAPDHGTKPFVIYIKNGTYPEKLFIEKSFITLLGEDREKTVIKIAELRRIFYENNKTDWGAATVNITPGAADLMFANLSIINNYAEVFPETPKPNDHAFTIRGGGQRVIIINCNIVSTGADTCSLWNKDNDGMYYHRGCFFTGWVDYLCPRGFCYVEGCDFFGYNKNASIWHDGSGNPEHKFVLQDCLFDGVDDFALGRYHHDGQFFLLHCDFAKTMRNKAIYLAETGTPDQWGKRVYYYDCQKENGDYDWHADNLSESGITDPAIITAQWTFNNQWNPEALIVGVVPYASMPRPVSGKRFAETKTRLEWIAGRCVTAHNVYFGTDADQLDFKGKQAEATFDPGELTAGTQYFWRVDELTMTGDTIVGAVWNFTTALNRSQ